MFEQLQGLFQADWNILMEGTQAWLAGGTPYGVLGNRELPGAFAYPPTALTWLAVFVPLGPASYFVWTALELALWWVIIRGIYRPQLQLLIWAPWFLHLLLGQITATVVLVLWAASLSNRRGWWWGVALAWTLTKPQTAVIPLAWLLWQDRDAPRRMHLWGGILAGTVVLALPPALFSPWIWNAWLQAVSDYRNQVLLMAPWQGYGMVLLLPAAWLWWKSRRGGWQWWLPAALFPQTSVYGMAALMPVLRPLPNFKNAMGLALAAVLQAPVGPDTLPLLLSGQLIAAALIDGAPEHRPE